MNDKGRELANPMICIHGEHFRDHCTDCNDLRVKLAVEAEREACAVTLEALIGVHGHGFSARALAAGAVAIRSRGSK